MIVLGSTGSIGVNTLFIAKKFNIKIEALVAGYNYKLLNEQIKIHNPKVVIVADKETKSKVIHNNVYFGEQAIISMIKDSKSDIVVNALVGFMGLNPTIESIKLNKTVALANKESLVVAGAFMDTSKIIAIDSEHFAIWYLLNGRKVSSITITASGGALRDMPLKEMENVRLEQVLSHPNWSMGNKITIDSATMVNKIFELIETKWLFKTNKVNALIEKNSYIHAIVDFIDGSSTMQVSNPDMKLAIAFALNRNLSLNILPHLDLANKSFEFIPIDKARYPIWEYKDEIVNNPNLGVVINASNELAISDFINKKISFNDISRNIMKSINQFNNLKIKNIDDIFAINKKIRG
jgi:1-deoxy-D-xylulose-5-phosphate reductoisomerase